MKEGKSQKQKQLHHMAWKNTDIQNYADQKRTCKYGAVSWYDQVLVANAL